MLSGSTARTPLARPPHSTQGVTEGSWQWHLTDERRAALGDRRWSPRVFSSLRLRSGHFSGRQRDARHVASNTGLRSTVPSPANSAVVRESAAAAAVRESAVVVVKRESVGLVPSTSTMLAELGGEEEEESTSPPGAVRGVGVGASEAEGGGGIVAEEGEEEEETLDLGRHELPAPSEEVEEAGLEPASADGEGDRQLPSDWVRRLACLSTLESRAETLHGETSDPPTPAPAPPPPPTEELLPPTRKCPPAPRPVTEQRKVCGAGGSPSSTGPLEWRACL